MNQTPNYQLSQWEATDKVQRVDFNAGNAKIDGTLAEHAAALAKLGNCQIWVSSYIGTGTCGASHPTSFTFPKKPVLALISVNYEPMWILPWSTTFATPQNNSISWSGSTATWHVNLTNPLPEYQLNRKNTTYYVVAFLAADQ